METYTGVSIQDTIIALAFSFSLGIGISSFFSLIKFLYLTVFKKSYE